MIERKGDSANLIGIIYSKYQQAKKALLNYSLSFRDNLSEGNKTRKKIRKFNTLNAIISYYENTIIPSTFQKGRAPSSVALRNIRLECIHGQIHPLDMSRDNAFSDRPGGLQAYTFALNPLHLYTTDVYGNIVTIAHLSYGWPATTAINNVGLNSLSESFGTPQNPAPTLLSSAGNNYGSVGLTYLDILSYYSYTASNENVQQYNLLLEKTKANLVSAINNTSSIFNAKIINGDVVINVVDKNSYGLFNLQHVYASPNSISFSSPAFTGGASEIPERASYSVSKTKEILNRLDIVASELGIVYTDSEDLNLDIDAATKEIIQFIDDSSIITYDVGSLTTESGETISGDMPETFNKKAELKDTKPKNLADDSSSLTFNESLMNTSDPTKPSSMSRSGSRSNTTTRSSSGPSRSGGGY
tara:strand:+ start:8543 stop:9790 length:1248 start_codon:yes stop_codon:yes gene_type:complete